MGKVVLLGVCAFVAGAAFLAVGGYFLTDRFLQRLNESSVGDEKAVKKK